MLEHQPENVRAIFPPASARVTDRRVPATRRSDDRAELVLDWPRRAALVVGDDPDSRLISLLHHLDFGTSIATMDQIERVAALAAPFTFVLVGQDELVDDSVVDVLRRVQACAPASRMLLCTGGGEPRADALLRAMRAGVADVLDDDGVDGARTVLQESLTELGRDRERVLAIGAHPDDIEIGCAGTLLDHRLRGDRVSVLTLSRGAVGGDTEQRAGEAVSASSALGAQLFLGNLPDTLIDEGIETIRMIEAVVAQVDPTVVYVHSKNDNHQDHRAVHVAAVSATRGVRRIFAYQSPSATNDYKPTQFAPIDHVLQRKIHLLMYFDSQNERSYLEPELVVAGSRYWARHLAANARYAEPFEVIRSVGQLRHSDVASTPKVAGVPAFGLPAFGAAPAGNTGLVAL